MAKSSSHPHKLRKHKYPTGNVIFFCTLPDCHYKIDAALALGKRAMCNICENEFIMSEYSLKLVKPHCPDCGKMKIRDADGRNRYVKKVTNKLLVGIATEASQDLRSRLANATNPDLEDDI